MFAFISVLLITMMITFLLKHYHLLNMLLSLEMMIVLCMTLMSLFFLNNKELYMMFIFLSLSTCESILGLTLFVMFIRFYSKDYMKFLFSMKY